MLLHEVRRRLLAHAQAPAANEDLSAEAKEALRHCPAQTGAATGNQNALTFVQALFEHGCDP